MLGDLPQWDLNDLYASINDSKLSSDKIEIEELTESFINKYQNKIATLSSENLNEAIRDYQTINQKLGKLYSYVSLTFSINTDKPDFGKKYQEIRELGSTILSKLVFLPGLGRFGLRIRIQRQKPILFMGSKNFFHQN